MHLSFNFSIPLTLTMSQIAGICIFSLPQPPAPHPHPICPVSGWVTTGTPSSKLLRGKDSRIQPSLFVGWWPFPGPWDAGQGVPSAIHPSPHMPIHLCSPAPPQFLLCSSLNPEIKLYHLLSSVCTVINSCGMLLRRGKKNFQHLKYWAAQK